MGVHIQIVADGEIDGVEGAERVPVLRQVELTLGSGMGWSTPRYSRIGFGSS